MSRGSKLLNSLKKCFSGIRGQFTPDMPMDRITWFRTGGLAEILFQPADIGDLTVFLRSLPKEIPVTVLGLGSNVLVRDGGIDGIVVRLSAKGFGNITAINDNQLLAGSASPLKRLSAKALIHNIDGFAFYHGIPGSVGGALRMNAGANGMETADKVLKVHAVDREGKHHLLDCDSMGYDYRYCGVPEDLIFTSAIFSGVVGDSIKIRQQMDAIDYHRNTVQPVYEKTGGSTFKNPPGQSAWKLIDAAGMRGAKIGAGCVSEMHCNFMINKGNANAYELEMLGEKVRSRVFEHSGVQLDWEIKRIGKFQSKSTGFNE